MLIMVGTTGAGTLVLAGAGTIGDTTVGATIGAGITGAITIHFIMGAFTADGPIIRGTVAIMGILIDMADIMDITITDTTVTDITTEEALLTAPQEEAAMLQITQTVRPIPAGEAV